ncbi:MerR family transcriptional regulator [Ornithinibacillus sp. JPR2-1]|uniref:MerR family transcriptional regulator n=1 Tax=Ornithinibacillus sp. JPR2-1 TaxID=2094019 RepID=UPI0031DF9E3D
MYSVGELAQMGNISVRTLQYYDEIGLLKPAAKTDGGNRLYGKNESMKLQQILALKFLGYPLESIKRMLGTMDQTWEETLHHQLQSIKKEQEHLKKMESAIRSILQSMELEEELKWDVVQQLVDLYKENPANIKRYLDNYFTQEEQQFLHHLPHLGDENQEVREWVKLIKEVKANLDKDPSSEVAQSIAKRWMDQVNTMFHDNEELRDKSWNEIKNNNSPMGNYPIDADVIQFIEHAVEELYKQRK